MRDRIAATMKLWSLYAVRFVTHILAQDLDHHPNIIRFLGVSKGNGEKDSMCGEIAWM